MPDPLHIDPELSEAARRLRLGIRDDGRDSARKLLEFAERYAVSTQLRDRALVLQMQSKHGAPEGAVDDLVPRMLALVEKIIEDHAAAGGTQAIHRREQLLVRMREHFLRRAPAHDTVFDGRALVKRFRGSDFEFGELDLRLRLGEITGVVGQNAHGKTTMLRIVAGELQPDRGQLAYPLLQQAGETIDWPLVKQSLAFVPQEIPPWSGALSDTLHYEAALHGILGDDNEREVRFIVERLDLGEHLDKRWPQLSGGYKLRFALARALVWKPRLLVMDEPLANLDIKAKNVLLQDVRDLARSYSHPIGVLMSSHELHSLESVCDQMVFLQKGKVLFSGTLSAFGAAFDTNEYEISTTLGAAEVRQRLADTVVHEVREDGVNLLLLTRPDVGHADVLRLLVESGIDVQYFRDNSRSMRRLFE